MPDIYLPFEKDTLLTYLAEPSPTDLIPGVVVIHDALGMSTDLRRQCDWLAKNGYRAAAPDLFDGRTFFNCLFKTLRAFNRREGKIFDKVALVRKHLLDAPGSNGKVGVIGFCFGGGFALILSAGYGYDAASVNYGGLPGDAEEELSQACPMVASFGALDRNLKGAAEKLEAILTRHGIPHDVKEYADTDHAFMNDHDPQEVPLFIKVISVVFGGGAYHPKSTADARKRILDFFGQHLH